MFLFFNLLALTCTRVHSHEHLDSCHADSSDDVSSHLRIGEAQNEALKLEIVELKDRINNLQRENDALHHGGEHSLENPSKTSLALKQRWRSEQIDLQCDFATAQWCTECKTCTSEADCVGLTNGACGDGLCVECTSDDHCTGGCSLAANVCVECTVDGHCNAGLCDTTTNTCLDVECIDDNHCTADRPVCDRISNTCLECVDNDQCTGSNVCINNQCQVCEGTMNSAGACVDCDSSNLCDEGSVCFASKCYRSGFCGTTCRPEGWMPDTSANTDGNGNAVIGPCIPGCGICPCGNVRDAWCREHQDQDLNGVTYYRGDVNYVRDTPDFFMGNQMYVCAPAGPWQSGGYFKTQWGNKYCRLFDKEVVYGEVNGPSWPNNPLGGAQQANQDPWGDGEAPVPVEGLVSGGWKPSWVNNWSLVSGNKHGCARKHIMTQGTPSHYHFRDDSCTSPEACYDMWASRSGYDPEGSSRPGGRWLYERVFPYDVYYDYKPSETSPWTRAAGYMDFNCNQCYDGGPGSYHGADDPFVLDPSAGNPGPKCDSNPGRDEEPATDHPTSNPYRDHGEPGAMGSDDYECRDPFTFGRNSLDWAWSTSTQGTDQALNPGR